MNREGDIPEIIGHLFPGARIARAKKRSYRNSQVTTMSLEAGGKRRKVVVKVSRFPNPEHVSREFEELSKFYHVPKDPRVSCPEPLFSDPERGIIVMGCIEGINLAWALHGLKPLRSHSLEEAMDLSALALAEYHKAFKLTDSEPLHADVRVKERDINGCLLVSCRKIDRGNLGFKVKPFFDFSAWNLVVDAKEPKVYLVDFPKADYVSTPHLDLGRFRFSLELIKQYPPSNLLGIDLWDISHLCGRFLDSYCAEIGTEPNDQDIRLIDCFARANIRRSQDTSRKDKYHWHSKLERIYLRTFSRGWLNKAWDS